MEEIKKNGEDIELTAEAAAETAMPDGMRNIPTAAELEELYPDTSFMGRVRRAFKNHGYLGLCFLVPALIMWLAYASRNVFPFGEESVLVLDLNGQYVYYFEALRDILTEGGSFLYSFRRALGGEFLGIIGYYLASPLSFIVALFPAEMITEALLVMFLIKTGLSGLTFGVYLDRTRKRNPVTAVMFSTMYALCAYAVVMQHNTMWIDSLIMLPLVLLGVEELIKHKKYKLFIISLSISVFSNFYIGYMTCIFVALYFFYYYYANEEEVRNPEGEKDHLLRSLIRIALSALLMLAITAVMVWSSYTALTFGKTTFTDPGYGFGQNFDFLDLVSKMYFGSYDTVRPEGWPFVYSGMLTFMLVPLYFFAKNVTTREKIATGIFITLMFVCFNATTLDIFWHGMQNPNWLNHRYSFMVCFMLIIMAHRAFENIDEIGYKPVIVSSAVIAAILMVLQKLEYENLPDLTAVWSSLAFIAVYLLMMRGVTSRTDSIKRTAVLVLTIFIGFEMYAAAFANLIALDDDVVFTTRTTYRNHMDLYAPAFEELQEMDPSFYRSEKVTYKRNNDNLAQGVFGLSNSTSTLNADTIQFLQDIGIASKSHWSKYLGSTPATDSLLGIKYLVGQSRSGLPEYYTEIEKINGLGTEKNQSLNIYQNPYAMSIAFGADSSIKDINFFGQSGESEEGGLAYIGKKLLRDLFGMEFNDTSADEEIEPDFTNPFDRLNGIYAALLGEESVNMFVNLDQTHPVVSNLTKSSVSGHTKYTPTDSSTASFITYDIVAETNDVIYMYIPTVYDRECKLTVNNTSKGTYFGNETHRIVALGSYEPGTKLTVKLELNKDNLYISTEDDNYFYYFDEDVYTSLVPRLKGSEFNVTEWTEDTLIGNISIAEGDETVFTTIPYDEGWKVICDGKEVEIFEVLDSLIAFELTPGEHDLVLKYRPDCAVYGSVISLAGIVIFVLLCVGEYVWKKKKAAVLPLPDSTVFDTDSDAADAETTESTDDSIGND